MQDMREYMESVYPEEGCGVIVDGKFKPLPNSATDKLNAFEIADKDLPKNVEAVVHSHPDGRACPSEADMRGQIAMDIPWVIIQVIKGRAGEILWWGTKTRPPLVGRGFRHGVTDCYALIRDWFLAENGVYLQEYPRNWEWWLTGDLYLENFENAGFSIVQEPQAGDVFLAQIRSKTPNHGGIFSCFLFRKTRLSFF